jgi:hypothetical protein
MFIGCHVEPNQGKGEIAPISWSGRTDRMRLIGFKGDRTEIAQAGMATLTVVKDLNVVKDRAPRLQVRLEALHIQAFYFEAYM